MNFFQKLFGKKNKTPEPVVIEQQAEQSIEPQLEPVVKPQTKPLEKPVVPEPVTAGPQMEPVVKPQTEPLEKPVVPEPAAEPVKTKPEATQSFSADAEAKKLIRRIKELEDDLEDAQDDAKDANKKLERTQTEKKALKEELERLEAEHNRIKNEHDTIKTEHAYTVEELELKKKSVDFVNEILNAPSISSQKVQEVAGKSTAIMNFVKDSICEAFRELYEDGKEVAALISSEIGKWENLQRKTWLKDKTVVAFMGQFNAGKTSIVNRIFTQDKKDAAWTLPTKREPTTAVATYISYGDNPRVMFTDPQDELRELPKDVFLQFTKKSLDNISVSRLVSHFVTEYNTENLRRMSILDTPGFNSGDKEDERRTMAVINEADVLFWVVDANAGDINTKSLAMLAIIRKHAAGTPIYVVINRIDTKPAPSEREKIETQMRKTLDGAKIPIEGFIRFSKEEPLEVLTTVIGALKPRRPDYDVIADINERLDTLIQDCKNRIAEEQKEATAYNRAINEAQSIIDTYDGKFERLTNKWNELVEEMYSDENKTIFGNMKIEDAFSIFDRQKDVVVEIIELDGEFTDAVEKFTGNSSKKEKSEADITTYKTRKNRLENLKAEFDKKLGDFGIETKATVSRQSSVQSQNAGTRGVRFPENLTGSCKNCKHNNGYGWCRFNETAPKKINTVDSCPYRSSEESQIHSLGTCKDCAYYNDNWCSWNSVPVPADHATCNHKKER
jgi:GTPase SAR1 family protein